MKIERITMGQPVDEVQAAMHEESCERCFGCPFATLAAAALTRRTQLLLEFTYGFNEFAYRHSMVGELEQKIDEYRAEIRSTTKDCSGYSETKRATGRPAKMCDSPEVTYSRISIIAGRWLEIIGG